MYRPRKNEPLMPVGQIVREWRRWWKQRVDDCTAVRDTWPSFFTKAEGAEYR